MTTVKRRTAAAFKPASAMASALLGLLVCCSTPQGSASAPQPIVPGTDHDMGVTAEQAVADSDVVARISAARCDRSQSCDRIGPGAVYRDRDDCLSQNRALVSRDLNASRCPGGIGEVGLSRCIKSLHLGECDMPGQVYSTTSHCKLDLMCLR